MTGKQLTPLQTRAIEFPPEGRLKIVAGAGSGKTEVLTHRIVALLKNGIKPEELVAITYTNKAAGSMKTRLAEKRGVSQSLLRTMQVSTFHSFLAKLIRADPFAAGLAPGYSVLTENSRQILISHLMERFQSLFFEDLISTAERIGQENIFPIVREFPHLLGRVRRFLLNPSQFHQVSTTLWRKLSHQPSEKDNTALSWFHRFYTLYLQRLEELGLIDFDDILIRGKTLLIELKDRGAFPREKIFLVDEFQDNNQEQLDIVKQFLAGRRSHLTVVGDPKQSIYRFQGAEIETFEKLEGAEEIVLNINFRSYEEILKLADLFYNPEMPPESFLQAHLGKSPRPHPVLFLLSRERNSEAEILAEMIQAMVRGNLKLKKHGRAVRYGDFAIIVSSIKNLPKNLEDALSARKIPYVISGGLGFYDRGEIREIVAFLRLLLNTNDDFSLIKILSGPLFGLPDSLLTKLAYDGRKEKTSLFQHLFSLPSRDGGVPANRPDGDAFAGLPGETLPRKAISFRKIFLALQGIFNQVPILELVYRILEDAGFLEFIALQKEDLKRKRMENNITKFIGIVRDFERNGIFSSLRDFLAYLDRILQSDLDENEAGLGLEDSEIVKIMTIHKAKGLEFPVVFLPFLKYRSYRRQRTLDFSREAGLMVFEGKSARKNPDDYRTEYENREKRAHHDEERRKYYVALTRAEELLVLSGNEGPAHRENQLLSEFGKILEENPGIGAVVPLEDWKGPLSEWIEATGQYLVATSPSGRFAGTPPSLDGSPPIPEPGISESPKELPEAMISDKAMPCRYIASLDTFLKNIAHVPGNENKAVEEIFSLQGLETFSACPRRYYLGKHIPTLIGKPPDNPGKDLGNLIHRTLKIFHDPANFGEPGLNKSPALIKNELLKIFEKLLPLHHSVEEKLAQKARDIFARYSETELALRPASLVEAEVHVRLQASTGPFLLHGFADRVDREEAEIHIFDYKTHSYSPKAHQNYTSQMALYLAAARQGIYGELGALNFAEVRIVYLTDSEIKLVPSEPDVQSFEKWAIATIDAIRADSFPPGKNPPCDNCHLAFFCKGKNRS